MTRIWTMGLALALVALTGACAGETADETALGESGASDAPATATPASAPARPTGGAALGVDTLQDAGAYLTDGSGRALYLLEGEPEGQSTCYDACAEEWPPFLTSDGAATSASAAVQSGLIGTLQRRDGTTQATYGGHALYYYHDDQGRGQTAGHDLTDQWGEWYLVQPNGEALEEHAESGSAE